MSKLRDRYFKGYVKEQRETDKKGKYKFVYVYHGNYYYWKAAPIVIKRYKIIFPCLMLVSAVIYLLTAFADWSASRAIYPSLPFVAAILPYIYLVIGMVSFCRVGSKEKEFEFEEMNLQIKAGSAINSGLLALSALLFIAWCIISNGDTSYILSACASFVCSACTFVIFSLHRKLRTVLVEEGDYGDIEDERYKEIIGEDVHEYEVEDDEFDEEGSPDRPESSDSEC